MSTKYPSMLSRLSICPSSRCRIPCEGPRFLSGRLYVQARSRFLHTLQSGRAPSHLSFLLHVAEAGLLRVSSLSFKYHGNLSHHSRETGITRPRHPLSLVRRGCGGIRRTAVHLSTLLNPLPCPEDSSAQQLRIVSPLGSQRRAAVSCPPLRDVRA